MRWSAVFCLSLVHKCQGWGRDGHEIVAAIAQELVDPVVRKGVAAILAEGETMVSTANWADEVGHTAPYSWSKCMHYVDSSGGRCSIDPEADCGTCCVIKAIGNYTARLGDPNLSVHDRGEALKFLVHFAGDVAQPLHAGHKEDMGGNLIHVHPHFAPEVGQTPYLPGLWNVDTEVGQTPNLHGVWDSLILDTFLRESGETNDAFVKKVVANLEVEKVSQWASACFRGGAECASTASEESSELACSMAYTTEDGRTIADNDALSREYFQTRMSVVEERLASAGVRLAVLLNQAFEGPTGGKRAFHGSPESAMPEITIS